MRDCACAKPLCGWHTGTRKSHLLRLFLSNVITSPVECSAVFCLPLILSAGLCAFFCICGKSLDIGNIFSQVLINIGAVPGEIGIFLSFSCWIICSTVQKQVFWSSPRKGRIGGCSGVSVPPKGVDVMSFSLPSHCEVLWHQKMTLPS